jgi:hypothetical protein
MTDRTDTAGLVDLASALEALRGQLETAWVAGQGRRVRFRVSDVTMTVEAVAGRERDGSGKVRWWLIEAGAGAKRSSQTTQTLVLTLTPSLHDDAGGSGPLDVHGEQPTPGR